MLSRLYGICLLFGVGLSPTPAQPLELAELFTDHAILQRNVEVPVWGWAAPGKKVKVVLNTETALTGRADKTGRWRVVLPAHTAGGPHRLTVTSGRNRVVREDIYFGDVWLCSGQSNMEWPLELSNPPDTTYRTLADPLIRQYKVALEGADQPQPRLPAGGSWALGEPEQLPKFTGVGYYFAREIRTHHTVPIGLLNSSWGGSRLEPWLSPTAYQSTNPAQVAPDADKEQEQHRMRAKIKATFGEVPTDTDQGVEQGWQRPDYDVSDWPTMELPGFWEERGYPMTDGVFWFRKTVTLTAAEAAAAAELSLGMLDDSDITYVNGQRVGSMDMSWNVARRYTVPADVLREGENTIAIKVTDVGYAGGVHGEPEQLYLATQEGKRSLAGAWQYHIGQYKFAVLTNQMPMLIYNAMIHPLQDFPLAGVLWYQGESNAGPEDALPYRDLFKTLITSWRQEWRQPELPFYFVQLANFMQPAGEPGTDSDWAVLRESQTQALDLPHTHQAVIIDIGEADDIHPRNKRDVGYRLALGARAHIYGETDLIYASPRLEHAERDDGGVVLRFMHTGGGLTAQRDRYGYLRGFELKDKNGVWYWAQARLEKDNTIRVKYPESASPVAVRYAWGDNPVDANVYTMEGLPLTPFRVSVEE